MTSLIARARGARTALLTVVGLGSLSASAWVAFGLAAGLAAAGAAALVLEYLTTDEETRR
ncbi:MAG: hypothetical protein ACJ768_11890 [Gaiellaceae bacterium]